MDLRDQELRDAVARHKACGTPCTSESVCSCLRAANSVLAVLRRYQANEPQLGLDATEERPISGCRAYQASDQMICGPCVLQWDVNDPEPPVCRPQR